ncbi:DUF6339 family protein [Agrobacterium tumefaciens]|uniref:DUF6339 family protein n=1 Tax=Agrobacterium tumefaciens TaxID=358 RepID=UPI00157401AC|nr:DUF6339 family protein [Agrobacterium tumefaciens]NSZ85240.1 hypothetical protein [Agrobacterium tumefaciens]WCA70490.1 DUF6339 family protein [Agrobacterium tumefaciens]
MSNVRLIPRLNEVGLTRYLEDLDRIADENSDLMDFDRRRNEYEAWIWYAPSGGSVGPELVDEIRRQMTAIASQHGYPARASDKQKVGFDVAAAKWLAAHPHLSSPELLRDDTWAFLSCIALQELVIWRYSARQGARFSGGVRNTFQRLWIRGHTLDLGETAGNQRWHLLEGLSEDAMVQIFERASIASRAELSQAIAKGWLSTAERIGRTRMEDVMRRATKLLRLRNQIIDLTFLSSEDLDAEVGQAFARSSEGISPAEGSDDSPGQKDTITSWLTRAIKKTGIGLPIQATSG